MSLRRCFVIFFPLLSLFYGCSYSNLPLQSKEIRRYFKQMRKQYPDASVLVYNLDSTELQKPYRYRVQPGDVIEIRAMNIPLGEQIRSQQGDLAFYQNQFQVNEEGYLLLPVVGFLYVKDMDVPQLREAVKEAYRQYYKEPIVEVMVKSLRVFVYNPEPKVVQLPYERTHLLEALALGQAFTTLNKISDLQIVRGDYRNPTVIWVNLKKLDILQHSELLVLHDKDVVVIPVRPMQMFLEEARTYLFLINILNLIPTYYFLGRNIGLF